LGIAGKTATPDGTLVVAKDPSPQFCCKLGIDLPGLLLGAQSSRAVSSADAWASVGFSSFSFFFCIDGVPVTSLPLALAACFFSLLLEKTSNGEDKNVPAKVSIASGPCPLQMYSRTR
jgi:hypothetical protein